MSFDIVLQSARFPASVSPDGTLTSIAPDPLPESRVKAVLDVLANVSSGPAVDGYYTVQVRDGGAASVYIRNPADGCMVSVHEFTRELMQFLYDLLDAAPWVMLPTIEQSMAITTSPENVTRAPDDFPRVVLCSSVHELGLLLTNGYEPWSAYRNQTISGGSSGR